MNMLVERLETPIRKSTDVLIVGGGIAGVAAALAARRAGAQVLLLEKQALWGGLATNGLISWYEPLCDGQGHQLMYGLAEELLRLSIRYGDDTLPEIWQDRSIPVEMAKVRPEKQHPVGGRYGTFFSPTLFQLALDELLLKEGVELRLDIHAALPVVDNGRVMGVVTESKSGRECYPAKVVIDATGDADLFVRAGLPCELGQNYLSLVAHWNDISTKKKAMDMRRWRACGADLHGVGHPEGYPLTAGVTNEEITRFLLDGRKMLLEKVKGEERTRRDVVALPTMPQLRTTRHLKGAYVLSEKDCRQPRADSIGLAADFERVGDWYEIPFGCLYHPDCANLLAAGRMVSAEGVGWEVTRVIPVCALTGQAAGVAAAQMATGGTAAKDLPVEGLQQALQGQGATLHRQDV